MIDLHCHILPGIDDGPKTLNESLELARIFAQSGYNHVVATPHAIPGTTWMPAPEEVQKRLEFLEELYREGAVSEADYRSKKRELMLLYEKLPE